MPPSVAPPSGDSLEDRIGRIGHQNMSYSQSLRHLVQTFVDAYPSARIIIAASTERGKRSLRLDGYPITAAHTLAHLRCSKVGGAQLTWGEYLRQYNDPEGHPDPMILLVDSSVRTTSAQGLDLYATNATIISDGTPNDLMTQVTGRCLRMQKKKQDAKHMILMRSAPRC
jgi:hypothetical protein